MEVIFVVPHKKLKYKQFLHFTCAISDLKNNKQPPILLRHPSHRSAACPCSAARWTAGADRFGPVVEPRRSRFSIYTGLPPLKVEGLWRLPVAACQCRTAPASARARAGPPGCTLALTTG